MKKYLICLFCLSMLLPVGLVSCGSEPWTVNRCLTVSQVGDDYVVGYLEGEGTVKVMCDAKGEGFMPNDCLEIHYRVSKLEEVDSSGNHVSYDYVLAKAISIRKIQPE